MIKIALRAFRQDDSPKSVNKMCTCWHQSPHQAAQELLVVVKQIILTNYGDAVNLFKDTESPKKVIVGFRLRLGSIGS
jgi:hypothetical protein